MKNKLLPIITILFLLIGVGLLAYPTISDWVNRRSQTTAIQDYTDTVSIQTREENERLLNEALEYNEALTGEDIKDPFIPGSGVQLPDNYTSILNVNGKMAYIEVPGIDIYLPIYHGTSEDILQIGIGHLEATAFPIGGEGNNTILTGHRGLSEAKLFTDLDKMEIDDIFYIYVLDEKLAYKVDQIIVVEPDDLAGLRPVKGEDYVTLVTCTPYAINSHRLLVRGTRTTLEEARELEEVQIKRINVDWRTVVLGSLGAITVVYAGVLIFQGRRRRKPR